MFILTLVTLVACGGGGGGSTTDTSSSSSGDTATTTGSTATTRGSDPVTYNCPTDKCVVIDMEDRFSPDYGTSDNIVFASNGGISGDNGGLGVTNWGDFSTAEYSYLGANPFTVLYDSTYPEKLQLTLNSKVYTITFDGNWDSGPGNPGIGDSGWSNSINMWFSYPASGIYIIGFN